MKSNFLGKKILVTGGDGFIGANLIKRLEFEGAEVYALLRKKNPKGRLRATKSLAICLYADLLDETQIKDQLMGLNPEYVFHTATLRDERNWQDSFKINTSSALNLFESVASGNLKKFVHFGSSFEYGNQSSALKETDPINPESFLGVCKASGTFMLQHFARKNNLQIVILRIFHVYGFLENEHRLIPTAIRRILSDEVISLTHPGYCHDFIFVDDLLEACLKAAQLSPEHPNIFNIASGKQTTNEEIVQMISELIGKPARVNVGEFPQRSWDKKKWSADISLAKALLNWQPRTDLKAGLKKMLDLHLKTLNG